MKKKAGFIGNILSLGIAIVFIYVLIKHPELIKEAGLWALDMFGKAWTFAMEKIASK